MAGTHTHSESTDFKQHRTTLLCALIQKQMRGSLVLPADSVVSSIAVTAVNVGHVAAGLVVFS